MMTVIVALQLFVLAVAAAKFVPDVRAFFREEDGSCE
jgi:hypothetical protein